MKAKGQDIISKIIVVLLAMQLFLIGLQAKIRIGRGESSLEALQWMIQQYIPVLVKFRSLQGKKPTAEE